MGGMFADGCGVSGGGIGVGGSAKSPLPPTTKSKSAAAVSVAGWAAAAVVVVAARACAAGRPPRRRRRRRVTSRRRHRYGRAAIGPGAPSSARPRRPDAPAPALVSIYGTETGFIHKTTAYDAPLAVCVPPRCARSFSVYAASRIRHTRLQFNKSIGASITCVCVCPSSCAREQCIRL